MSIMTIQTKIHPTFSGAGSAANDLNHVSKIFIRQTLRHTCCGGPSSVNFLIPVYDDNLPEQARHHRNTPDNRQG
ncbi:hypothetical protein G3601_005247 [Salmonella enterica]|nr:hypothetical protein [Salmonella enterica]EDH5493357.1 hypothetical protein [Salmonella enterica subsp. enterica serovar Java]EDQ0183555.1 hypothetical protein [Salmonella enterica subsp. enterica serovar 4,[5],12:b:-]EEE5613278.1 hypothetical protein [Salmonella enterica subsp. enterica serovar Typhimurium]EKN5804819.1 hypothetical protein [Salmonella enterica subsp. enterica]